MSFRVESGRWSIVWRKKKASTAFAKNTLVDLVSGYVQPSTSSSAKVFGLNQDSEYASSDATTDKIPVLVPRGLGLVRGDVTSGTLLATHEGSQFDLKDAAGVDVNANTNKPVRLVRFISASEGIFAIETQISS